MKRVFQSILPLLAIVVYSNVASAQSTVTEQRVSKTTYPFSDPNPVVNPNASIYPYFRFEGFSKDGRPQEWTVVELENEFVKLTIYPEIGGKVWGATEKKNGNKFLYDNSVVKFREIAMRGPWTSGGVEFNFGVIGHAPSTATPVDYVVRTNADGSVSCFVGTIDLLTRTWWNVEVKLERDKAFFTTDTYWYNPRATTSPLYNWMNAAYPVSEQLEFCFPGSYSVGHGGEITPWPVDAQGRDISWYKNNDFHGDKSLHITGSLADHYASYYHDKGKDFGSVHHSKVGEKLGKKLFLWAQSRQGAIWEPLLSDGDGQYAELQSGRLYNQEAAQSRFTPFKHNGIAGNQSLQFTEYWYATLSTGGVAATNEWGTLNFDHKDGALNVRLSPLQAFDEKIVVECDGREIFSEMIAARPLELWSRSIACPDGKLRIVVGDGLLTYDGEPAKLTRPNAIDAKFDYTSLYGLYTMGRQMALARDYVAAQKHLEAALAIDPLFVPALEQMAQVKYIGGDFVAAKALAATALGVDTYLPQANLLFSSASLELGQLDDAIDGATVAGLSSEHRTAGMIGAAKGYAARGDWNEVVFYADKTLERGFNPEAYQLLSVAYRNMGQKAKALEALKKIDEVMPLNHFVGVEKMLMGEITPAALVGSVRCELPYEVFIELGIFYETIQAKADALALYQAVPFHPLIAYRQAYLTGEAKYIAIAEAASPAFVLPSRGETLRVMEFAASKSSNWKTRYYRSLLQLSLNDNVDAAIADLNALAAEPDFAPFYLTRAAITRQNVLADLKRSETLDRSARVGVALIEEYLRLANYSDMLKTATQYYKLYPKNEKIQMGYINALTANNRLEDALRVMRTINVLPFEGSTIGRTMYREANLELAIKALNAKKYKQALQYVDDSELWLENLGVGTPYEDQIDTRSENYLRALIFDKMGDKARSAELFKGVAEYEFELNPNTVLSALAMNRLGRSGDGDALMARFETQVTNANVVDWSRAIYRGDVDKARHIATSTDVYSTSSAPGGPVIRQIGYLPMVIKIVEVKL